MDDARRFFKLAKNNSHNNPDFIVTDGLRAYQSGFKKEFYKNTKPRTEHIRCAGITKKSNNNPVERLYGTIRERTKTMRGDAKQSDSKNPHRWIQGLLQLSTTTQGNMQHYSYTKGRDRP